MAVAPPPCRPGPPPPSPQDPAPRLNETEWGPRFPIGSSAATLENARYTAAGPPSMDHPNEDRFFAMEGGDFQVMAVFDGHDGARAAGFASNFVLSLFGTQSWRQLVRHGREHINHALQEFFLAAEKEFFQSIERHTHEWEQLRTALPAVSHVTRCQLGGWVGGLKDKHLPRGPESTKEWRPVALLEV